MPSITNTYRGVAYKITGHDLHNTWFIRINFAHEILREKRRAYYMENFPSFFLAQAEAGNYANSLIDKVLEKTNLKGESI